MALEPDTIVARATAPGPGAVALVRLSGRGALAVLQTLREAAAPPPERLPIVAWLRDPVDGRRLDQVVLTVRRAPDTYTGEDLVEISCHGGWLIAETIVDACARAGARLAEAGEFTRRAYLNGKLDLLQAEAIGDLVGARSRALLDAATEGLDRGLSERVAALRAALIGLQALLVHHLDFPEEDDPPVPVARIAGDARSLEEGIRTLLATAPEGELLREGALTVLAGAPNAGKSSLFNALLGRERAIVTDVPGTTRDALEAAVQIGGYPFLLVDTAGLRETRDVVERRGVEVAAGYVGRAQLVLFCVEAGAELTDSERTFIESVPAPVVLIRTKADQGRARASEAWEGVAGELSVSAFTGEGLDAVAELLPRLVFAGLVETGADQPVITRRRQREGLANALLEVEGFRVALEEGLPVEVAAAHLSSAESALEELVGAVEREEVLDRVFSDFCIGK